MKKMAFFFSFFSLTLFAQSEYQSSDCYKKYISKHKSKIAERERQMSIMLYGYPITPSNGGQTVYLRPNNYQVDEVEFFEREITSAADFDLIAYSNTLRNSFSPPNFLKESYEVVKKEIPTVTYHEVQVALREGLKDGDYCKWYGIYKPKKVTKAMVKKVKEIRRELASVSGVEIDDHDRELGKDAAQKSEKSQVKESSASQK